MGFLGPIPASKLAAKYDTVTQTLTLSAEGEVIESTSGIYFKREDWIGGLKFSLLGWTGPIIAGPPQPYTVENSFQISILPFPKDVIIADANHPDGELVEIVVHFGDPSGLPPQAPANGTASTAPTSADGKPVPELSNPTQETINVLYGKPFTIKHAAKVPDMGTIDISFDRRFLELQSAGIYNNQIVWIFDSLESGSTQVIVTIRGGLANFVMRVIYDVIVFALTDVLEPGPVIPQGSNGATDEDGSDLPGPRQEVLSFLGRLNIARNKVLEQYPEAALYLAEAYTNDRKGVTKPALLGHMRATFRVEGGTVIIMSTGFSSFGTPRFMPGPIVGNANVDWPVAMDATEADRILKKEGHDGPYTAITLSKPLHPDMADRYGFKMVDGIEQWVVTNPSVAE